MLTYTIPLHIIDLHDDGYHPLLDIGVFGKSFKVVLDTGASRTAFDREMLLQAEASLDILQSSRLSTGLGTNTMESATALISGLQLGDLSLPALEVAVLDLSTINIAYRELGHPEVLGVVGSDILMKYKAVIDFGKQALMLRGA